MELKTKYQYSYFIYPYIIEEKKYSNHILKLLNDKHCKLKIYEKQKDLDIYTYFLPKARNFMFWTFNMNDSNKKTFEELDDKIQSSILSKYPCVIFEYNLGEDVQGKIGEKNGIFFEISKIEIICFSSGICFIVLKTDLEEENNLSNLLNFNYKFRDINSEFISLKDFENIRLQTNSLKDIKDLSKIIKNITGVNKSAKELNIEQERFFTYSYVCIDQQHWNETNKLEDIQTEFTKFMNILPYNTQTNQQLRDDEYISITKYAKVGITSQSAVLFTSSIDMQNYTKLPFSFEREYLYTYILSLYQKIYLKKLEKEFTNIKKIQSTKRKFIKFTQDIWMEEITNDIQGSCIYNKNKEVQKIDETYNAIKEKYDIYYKHLNIDKNQKTNYILGAILIAILIFNIINFVILTFNS